MAISRRALFGKLNLSLFRALESATAFAKLRGNPYVELTHWIHQLWQLNDSDLHRIARHYTIDSAVIDRDLSAALSALPAGATSLSDFSHHVGATVERAWILASLEFGDRRIRSAWLLAALVQTPELRRLLLGISPAFQKIPVDALSESLAAIVAGSPEDHEGAYDGSGLTAAVPGEASGAMADATEDKSALAKYCSDLTARARAGGIDPVIGREHEIRTMVDILLRRRQNNPLLTGEAGVGKTAVVEGLALAIARAEVPPTLREVRLLSLDVGALLAGASMRGEFEARLKQLLEEASASTQPVILFVDEVHTLIGAGGQAGTGDAANLLKPALARGTLRTVGATTWSEYKRHIEKDPALTRRFQVLQVMEPEEASAIDMVRGLVPTFAEHHGVMVLDEAVRAAVVLSHRYIPARQLPDKAISLLDTACARVAMSLHTPPASVQHLRQRILALDAELALLANESVISQGAEARAQRAALANAQKAEVQAELAAQEARWQQELSLVQRIHALRSARAAQETPADEIGDDTMTLGTLETALQGQQGDAALILAQVDEAVVAAIIADWTGIPVGRMVKDEVAAVFGLHATLNQRVIGQSEALTAIAERVQTARARLTDPNKPVGVFLLVGPSGVGKTETALALAEAMYGGEQNLITINMSEFQEAHTVSSLKGAPPGYVGYGEGGVLTEAVRRKPYSVILLDEVEKAHPDVHEMFYQVFDKGWMEDGEGRHIDFRNTTILLTSNTGSELIATLCEDPALVPDTAALRDALQPELRQVFPAAFIGRLAVVPYLPLGEGVLSNIVRLHLGRVADRMREQHGIELLFSDAFTSHVIARSGTHETGARRLIGFIEQNLLPVLSRHWLQALQDKRVIAQIAVDVEPLRTDHGLREGDAIACRLDYA
ncbi:type VI secretion system ATPase TssH [Variovorax arabinosiphilus]|uniref:type VI secretion system ATPase TssH n=1 Tax=Variovorax arabinosiphilus TaxID=3053498 RepID=UPI0025790474|nr:MULTISPECIES: type VI secretion system ATPase TssH [unclassified Variovorax]MDM0123465.1 type VI secretion system ATPase TssH [Variovorax sp. J2L1-78]MDM0132524.1 type VI secretion system ATPase TssH [Variovorax sp. J2L1-63]MDM0236303.1 type VI secretion system ATPase TssH [Variovorax sp. J2R1-6]